MAPRALPTGQPLVYHGLFWLAYFAFGALISLSIHHIYEPQFYWQLLSLLPPDMLLVYFNLYFLIPAFLFKRRYLPYFCLLSIAIFLQSAGYIWLHRLYAGTGTAAYAAVREFNLRNLSLQALNAIYLIGLTMGLKFARDRMIQQQHWEAKERQQVETELSFLRAQIHPHFFFNTLNNLYSLCIQKSDLAPEIILKLSGLMNYMLYESASPTVPLEKEIAALEDYIAIERLRFGHRLSLSFTKEGDTASVSIPPLILMTFVENSFKHSLKTGLPSIHIDIHCRVHSDHIQFHISNPLPAATSPAPYPVPPSPANSPAPYPTSARAPMPGIGLKNVSRRLELLFGNRYTLDMPVSETLFIIQLKIPYA